MPLRPKVDALGSYVGVSARAGQSQCRSCQLRRMIQEV
jgi:hypothetical protein